MPFSALNGNEAAKQALLTMWRTQKVPHALLFSGPAGSDKRAFARAFAYLLLGSNNSPDLHLYAPEGKSNTHPIATLRSLIDEMALPPYAAPCKVFIIEEAERMLPAAASALLKTLEEPPPSSYLILTTSSPDALLPTLISRCRHIHFSKTALTPDLTRLAPYLTALKQKNYPALLQAIEALEEEDPEQILHDLSHALPDHFTLLSRAYEALHHNIRLRSLLLHIAISVE